MKHNHFRSVHASEIHKSTFLGEGAYGQCFTAIIDKNKVAVKYMTINPKLNDKKDGIPSSMLREITILKRLNHINVVKYLGCSYELKVHPTFIIIMELLDSDLKTYLQTNPRLSIRTSTEFIAQILEALTVIHAEGLMHRDVKPANILVQYGERMILKLADFGLCKDYRTTEPSHTGKIATLSYRPLEVLMKGNGMYGPEVDIWSAGVIFLEMITGKCQFVTKVMDTAKQEEDTIRKIFRMLGKPSEQLYPELAAIQFPSKITERLEFPYHLLINYDRQRRALEGMLCYDPMNRMTAAEALATIR